MVGNSLICIVMIGLCFYLVEDMEEPNATALFENLYAKEVLVVKGRDERKKKLQHVEIFILLNELNYFLFSGFY
jgi:hypothetical protein